MQKVPANIAAIAQAMIARGVEQADLDYTLELVISNSDEIMRGHQAECWRRCSLPAPRRRRTPSWWRWRTGSSRRCRRCSTAAWP